MTAEPGGERETEGTRGEDEVKDDVAQKIGADGVFTLSFTQDRLLCS